VHDAVHLNQIMACAQNSPLGTASHPSLLAYVIGWAAIILILGFFFRRRSA
jgi:high-affinity Fe2+/Pb2+ permease